MNERKLCNPSVRKLQPLKSYVADHRQQQSDETLTKKCCAVTPPRNQEREITRFTCTSRDANDPRRMQADSQTIDAMGRQVGGVAHDFNNLLLIISAYAELMLDSLVPDHPLRHNANEIINASRRGADLTRQLMALGRTQVQSLRVVDPSQD